MKTKGKLERLLSKRRAPFINTISVIAVLATIATLSVPFYYNHWIGELSRMLFLLISGIIGGFVISCFNKLSKYTPRLDNCIFYWRNLIIVFCLLALEILVAGFTIHINKPCWDIKSGKLEHYRSVRWDNPFDRTIVLLNTVPNKSELRNNALFQGRKISIDLNSEIRIGTSADLLINQGYVSSITIPNEEVVEKIIAQASDRAFVGCGVTIEEFDDGTSSRIQQRKYLSLLREKIEAELPDYLQTERVEVKLE